VYKKLIENKKAIFFDLDGTIVDTSWYWTQAVGTVLEKIGIGWITDEHKYIPGENLETQWKNLVKEFGIKTDKDVASLVKETNEEFLKLLNEEEELEATEGFWDFIYEIKKERNLKTALITNSHKDIAIPILKKIDAETIFDLIVCGDDVSKPKPNPEIFKKALKDLNLKPEEVLVFEDSLAGTEAARAADLEMVVIWDERYPESLYKGKIYMFVPDFTPFPGNMNLTYPEFIEYYAKQYDEKDKKIRETKASDLGKAINQ
jgi:beta-phosphoglucomutase